MSKDSKARYSEIVKQHFLPLFFQPWWMDMVSSKWDVAIAENGQNVEGVWVYTLEKKIGVNIIRNPLLTPYLGPVFFISPKLSPSRRSSKEEKIFEQLFQQLPKWDFMDVMCLPAFNNFLSFHHQEFNHTQRITYHVDLSFDKDVLFENVNSKQRYAIRQAAKELTITDGKPFTKQFYELHKQTLTGKGKNYPYTQTFIKKIIDTSLQNKKAFFKAAVNANNAIAAMIFTVYDDDCMYLLLTATNKEAKHNGAVALLIWEAILEAKNKGLKIFDFEGSMDKGIGQFFRSFGGERKTYLHAYRNTSKMWKLKELIR